MTKITHLPYCVHTLLQNSYVIIATSTMSHKVFARDFIGAAVALTVVAALLAPLTGPMFDHHFAERQPDHHHFGVPGEHTHAFEAQYHIHKRAAPASTNGNLPIALYKSDASIAATIAASPIDVDSASMRRFLPTSVFILPPHLVSAALQHAPIPPDRPPALHS
jgi:hypothetical protein